MENIGVCVIIQNTKGEILIGERINSYKAGWYGMPGGRIEKDETLEEACQREVMEETGLKIEKFKYVGVVREFQQTHTFVHFGFIAQKVMESPRNMEPDKCKGWEWFSQDHLPEKILRGHRAVIKMFGSGENLEDLV